jgi:lysine 2,3-aminomutase
MLVRYQAEDKPNTIRPTATRGVSSLLQGTRTALVPENNERLARRRLNVLTNPAQPHEGEGKHEEHTGNGCCNGTNGHTAELVALHVNGETYQG